MKQRDRIRELLRSAHQRALRGEWEMVHQDVADALRVAESDPENQYYARLDEAAERIRRAELARVVDGAADHELRFNGMPDDGAPDAWGQ